jgi:hypothetical protein
MGWVIMRIGELKCDWVIMGISEMGLVDYIEIGLRARR